MDSTITVRKAQNQVKYEQRRLRLDSVGISADGLVDPEPSPDFVAMMNDTVEQLLRRLKDVNRDVALSKMAGFTNQEIADTLKVSVPTVERKLRVIRRVWNSENDR